MDEGVLHKRDSEGVLHKRDSIVSVDNEIV
jgi:hypothetical protein